MQKFRRYLIKVLFVLVTTIVALIVIGIGILIWINQIDAKSKLEPIAKEIGIKNWDELDDYMDKTFVEGMSREEVHKRLEKFGDYEIVQVGHYSAGRDRICERIKLPTGKTLFPQPDLQYQFCYLSDTNNLEFWALWPG